MKKDILITGATGAQGGSVARCLLAHPDYHVRILTRNPASPAAKALELQGAEIFEGDLADKQSLLRAMKGSYAVFGITNFWEHFGYELQLGKNLVDAVQESNITHFIFHTLPSYAALSKGAFPTPHCDVKAELQESAMSLQIPATFVHTAFYYENFLTFFPLQEDPSGNYSFGFPQGSTLLAMTSVEDVGTIVLAVLQHPVEYIGRTIGVVAEDKSCTKYAELMSEVLGINVRYEYIQREVYAGFGFPGAAELANMFEVQRQFIPERLVHKIESYALNPNMKSFRNWLLENKTAMIKAVRKIEAAPIF